MPSTAERKGRREADGAALVERLAGLGEERLGQTGRRVLRADRRQLVGCCAAAGSATALDPQLVEQPAELILDDVGERARRPGASGPQSPRFRQLRHQAARQASSPWVKVVSMPLPE